MVNPLSWYSMALQDLAPTVAKQRTAVYRDSLVKCLNNILAIPSVFKNSICFMQHKGSQIALKPPLWANCLHPPSPLCSTSTTPQKEQDSYPVPFHHMSPHTEKHIAAGPSGSHLWDVSGRNSLWRGWQTWAGLFQKLCVTESSIFPLTPGIHSTVLLSPAETDHGGPLMLWPVAKKTQWLLSRYSH